MQKFSIVFVNGTRSGSGKIILEHIDWLKITYEGSLAAVKIPSCIDNGSVNDNTGFCNSNLFGDRLFKNRVATPPFSKLLNSLKF